MVFIYMGTLQFNQLSSMIAPCFDIIADLNISNLIAYSEIFLIQISLIYIPDFVIKDILKKYAF